MQKCLENLLRQRKKPPIVTDKDKIYCFYEFVGGIEQAQAHACYRPRSKVLASRKKMTTSKRKGIQANNSKRHCNHLSFDSVIQKRQNNFQEKLSYTNFCLISKKITVKKPFLASNNQANKQQSKYLVKNPLKAFENFSQNNKTLNTLKNEKNGNFFDSQNTSPGTTFDDQYLISKLKHTFQSKTRNFSGVKNNRKGKQNELSNFIDPKIKESKMAIKNWDLVSCKTSRTQTPVFYL